MSQSDEIKRYQENLRAEREAIALYQRLADAESNPERKTVYQKLIATEQKHADFWLDKLKEAGVATPQFRPNWRTRIFGVLASRFGPSFVLPSISSIERKAASGYNGQADAEAANMPADERSHARIFGLLTRTTPGLSGSDLARVEGRHRSGGGNALRAAVLGANDGLVSVFSLVMGVAGAGLPAWNILMTGVAGLLAGALSMALGEWLSVQSSRELYQHQLEIEGRELAEVPEEEREELTLIYQAKGLDQKLAGELAERILADPATAMDTLAREELGIDPEELGGSAWEAAFTSFLLFAAGAIIPVFPYLFFTGWEGIVVSAAFSAIGLFVIGALITLLTGRNPLLSGFRQVLVGLATAAVTYGVGSLIGVNLAG
jgi:VIT1/CCC1 family predicted Fe2+/Mn2+ transporter